VGEEEGEWGRSGEEGGRGEGGRRGEEGGREVGRSVLEIWSTLPECISNRAHAQYDVEVVPYSLNEICEHCIRHVSNAILLGSVSQSLPHLCVP